MRREVLTWSDVDKLIDYLVPQIHGRFDSMMMRVALASELRSLKVLLSNDIDSDSRVLLHRNIVERMRRVVPADPPVRQTWSADMTEESGIKFLEEQGDAA